MNSKVCGCELAKYYNRKYGIITYSGTLAIEYSLRVLNLNQNSNILVLSTVCSSIINTIIKCGYNPIIVEPFNGYSLTDKDIDLALSNYKIDCILLVHQFGMMNKVNQMKYKKMKIRIIEDVSQIFINDEIIKSNSDIIITSFGITKPLSYGIGGAVLFNNEKYYYLSDFCDNESRKSNHVLLSYMYPKKINIKKLIKKGYKNIAIQKCISKKYYEILKKKNFCYVNYDDESSYHRFILRFDKCKSKEYDDFIEIIKETKLKYQLEHDIELIDLPVCKGLSIIKNEEYKYVYLRTRNISCRQQLKKLSKTIKNIDSMV